MELKLYIHCLFETLKSVRAEALDIDGPHRVYVSKLIKNCKRIRRQSKKPEGDLEKMEQVRATIYDQDALVRNMIVEIALGSSPLAGSMLSREGDVLVQSPSYIHVKCSA